MKDQSRTKQELLEENAFLKQRIQELEHSESEQKQAELVKACHSELAVYSAEAYNQLAYYVETFAGPPTTNERDRPFLAGNSIHANLWMIYHFLPHFRDRLNRVTN